MKDYLFLCVFVLSFYFSNDILISNARITTVLTPKVASNGLLILNTSTLPVLLKKDANNQFKLTVQNLNTNAQTTLSCFLFQFEEEEEEEEKKEKVLKLSKIPIPKAGCFTKGLKPGKYLINPISIVATVVTKDPLRAKLRIDPSQVDTTFEVTSGSEMYFYDYGKKDENFEFPGHYEDIEFSLFEPASGFQTVYLGDIPIECYAVNLKLTCNMLASMFPGDKKVQIYNVYIKDSLGNKKRNYFVQPVNITFNYL